MGLNFEKEKWKALSIEKKVYVYRQDESIIILRTHSFITSPLSNAMVMEVISDAGTR